MAGLYGVGWLQGPTGRRLPSVPMAATWVTLECRGNAGLFTVSQAAVRRLWNQNLVEGSRAHLPENEDRTCQEKARVSAYEMADQLPRPTRYCQGFDLDDVGAGGMSSHQISLIGACAVKMITRRGGEAATPANVLTCLGVSSLKEIWLSIGAPGIFSRHLPRR